MTDEQIMEALECCITQDGTIPCYSCPCWDYDNEKCKGLSYSDILSLIARQKAKIEKFETAREKQVQFLNEESAQKYELIDKLSSVRSEVCKEFAERLNTMILPQLASSTLEKKEAYYFCLDEIDNLVKEMTEVSDENV